MKKFLSITLALVLALSMSVTAFAASIDTNTETDTGTTNNTEDIKINYGDTTQGGTTNVKYSVAPAYTVTIPASVTIDSTSKSGTATVSAEGVALAKGSQVVVRLTGINVTSDKPAGDDEFIVKTNEGAKLKYTVKIGTTDITTAEASNTVLTVDPSITTAQKVASGTSSLTFALNDTVQYAGEYTGTVTFTVSVEDVSTNSGTNENP